MEKVDFMQFFAVFCHEFLRIGGTKNIQNYDQGEHFPEAPNRRLGARGPKFCCWFVVLATYWPPKTPISICGHQAHQTKFRQNLKIFEKSKIDKTQNHLSERQTVPNVRTYIFFIKIDILDLFKLRKIWRGSPEISGALQRLLKTWNIRKIPKNHEKSLKISNI